MFVRRYAEDRELTAWLLLDRSPSMGFGPVERTKERVLCEVAATIAQLVVRGGNRVGAVVYDNESAKTIPPRQGRDQVLALIKELLRPVRGRGAVTDLRKVLYQAGRVVRRRSRASDSAQVDIGFFGSATDVMPVGDATGIVAPGPLDAVPFAVERRVRIYTIGFGTSQPTTLACTAQQLGGDTQRFGGGGPVGGGGGPLRAEVHGRVTVRARYVVVAPGP